MLRSIKILRGYPLKALDGKIGHCRDFLLDDMQWKVRYMVADTGHWLPGRKVLVSPLSLSEPDWENRVFPVNLTKEQIENAPSIDESRPVSREYEMEFYRYFNWEYYWVGTGFGGIGVGHPAVPPSALEEGMEAEGEYASEVQRKSHIRSANEIVGYHVKARDSEVGHIEDLIVDGASWNIRYVVVETRNWLPGKKVLLAPDWLLEISWLDRRVLVAHDAESIRNCPEYDPSEPVNRQYEIHLYDYYGRPKYWKKES